MWLPVCWIGQGHQSLKLHEAGLQGDGTIVCLSLSRRDAQMLLWVLFHSLIRVITETSVFLVRQWIHNEAARSQLAYSNILSVWTFNTTSCLFQQRSKRYRLSTIVIFILNSTQAKYNSKEATWKDSKALTSSHMLIMSPGALLMIMFTTHTHYILIKE